MEQIEVDNLKRVLDKFGKTVIKKAVKNIDEKDIIRTGALRRSLTYEALVYPNSFSFDIKMESYGIYQDQGTYQKLGALYSKRGNLRLPIRVANMKKGSKRGIKPTFFLTEPFEEEFKKLDEDVVEAFGLDLEEFFQQVIPEVIRLKAKDKKKTKIFKK